MPVPLNRCPAEVCCQALLWKANTKSTQTPRAREGFSASHCLRRMQNPPQAAKTFSLTPAGCRSGLGQAKPKRAREKYQQQVFTCIFHASNIHIPSKMPCNESSDKVQAQLCLAGIEGHQPRLRMRKRSSSRHITHHGGFAPMFPRSHSTKPSRRFNPVKSDTGKTDIKGYIQLKAKCN